MKQGEKETELVQILILYPTKHFCTLNCTTYIKQVCASDKNAYS